MGGIIALINKNTGDDEHLEARIKDLGIENNTTKNRLESLESWIVDETIRNIKDIIGTLEGVPKDLKGSDNQDIKCNI